MKLAFQVNYSLKTFDLRERASREESFQIARGDMQDYRTTSLKGHPKRCRVLKDVDLHVGGNKKITNKVNSDARSNF